MPTVKIEIEEHSGTQWHTEYDIGFPLNRHHPDINETSFERTFARLIVLQSEYRPELSAEKLLEQIEYHVVELTRGKAAELEAKKAEAALPEPVGEWMRAPAPPIAQEEIAWARSLVHQPPPVAQEEIAHQAGSAEAPVRKRRGRPPRVKAEDPSE